MQNFPLSVSDESWRGGMEHCKNKSTYLIGNANIYAYTLNVTSACTGLNNTDQRWIGVVRDLYIKSDQGKLKGVQYMYICLFLAVNCTRQPWGRAHHVHVAKRHTTNSFRSASIYDIFDFFSLIIHFFTDVTKI